MTDAASQAIIHAAEQIELYAGRFFTEELYGLSGKIGGVSAKPQEIRLIEFERPPGFHSPRIFINPTVVATVTIANSDPNCSVITLKTSEYYTVKGSIDSTVAKLRGERA